MNYTDFGGKQTMSGFLAGVSYDLQIKNEWYIFTGVTYSQFGLTKFEQISPVYAPRKFSYRHGFLDIPIHAAFVMEVYDNMYISVEAGPKLSYALFGTQTQIPRGGGSEIKTDIYAKGNNISPFNVLVGFGVGIQYSRFRFKIGYDASLLNQYSGIENATASHGGLSLSLGYVFK
jgi:hypothetical protein